MANKHSLLIALMNKKAGPAPKKDEAPKESTSFDKWTAVGSDLIAALASKDGKRVGQVLQAATDLGGEAEEAETPTEEASED